jgi:hypothetical protein
MEAVRKSYLSVENLNVSYKQNHVLEDTHTGSLLSSPFRAFGAKSYGEKFPNFFDNPFTSSAFEPRPSPRL